MRLLADRRTGRERLELLAASAEPIRTRSKGTRAKKRGDYGKPRGFQHPLTPYQIAKQTEQQARMREGE